MPNYCTNVITISNLTPENIKLILNKYCSRESGSQYLDFEKILPTPKELLDDKAPYRGEEDEGARRMKLYGAMDWYEWRIQNWGVKWNPFIDSSNVEVSEDEIEVFCDTAWSPPVGIIKYFSTLFPNAQIRLKFAEPGAGYSGQDLYQNGEVLESDDDPTGEIMREIYGEPEEDEGDDIEE